ncbi:hypothetical protein ACRAWF_27065 [Streptomyces sp. L7]
MISVEELLRRTQFAVQTNFRVLEGPHRGGSVLPGDDHPVGPDPAVAGDPGRPRPREQADH